MPWQEAGGADTGLGNRSVDPAIHWLGTTNRAALIIRTNDQDFAANRYALPPLDPQEALRITPWLPGPPPQRGRVGIATQNPLYPLHVTSLGGFGPEDANGVSQAGNVPIVAQSNSTAFGVLNADGRQAFALNIDNNAGTNTARGVPTFYDKYDGNWHACLSLRNGKVGISGGATVNGVAIGTAVPNVAYPYEYEMVGVTQPNFNLRLQSPNWVIFHTGNPPAEKMQIRADGDVTIANRIGNVNFPPDPRTGGWYGGIHTWDVEAEGTIWSMSGYNEGSDARMKANVAKLSKVLDKLDAIRGVSFERIKLGTQTAQAKQRRYIGVIAQEVETVFPELVSEHGDEKNKAVNYSGLTGVLIEAAKELKAENEALRSRIEALEGA